MDKHFLEEEEKKKNETLQQFLKKPLPSNKENRFENFITQKIISWEEIEKWIDMLSLKIAKNNYCGIYGIPKGGLILAILLAYKTKLPLLMAPKKGCLIVDDDMTSGTTLLPFHNRYDTAVMFVNPDCPILPTYYYEIYTDECFRYFAWNREMGE